MNIFLFFFNLVCNGCTNQFLLHFHVKYFVFPFLFSDKIVFFLFSFRLSFLIELSLFMCYSEKKTKRKLIFPFSYLISRCRESRREKMRSNLSYPNIVSAFRSMISSINPFNGALVYTQQPIFNTIMNPWCSLKLFERLCTEDAINDLLSSKRV